MMKDQQLFDFTLMLADSSLIMSQRLSEWNGHGPDLEMDIALTNITLDLLGQARFLYQFAATLKDKDGSEIPATEDTLAYLRDAHEFKNVLLAELPNDHWGYTIMKLFFFVHWQQQVYNRLVYAKEKAFAAIAEKSLKETAYHIRWTDDWVKRLGDGTQKSHAKMESALVDIWPYTGELFEPAPYEENIFGKEHAVLFDEMNSGWQQKVLAVIKEATLTIPDPNTWMQTGGKKGTHTEHLGYILAEMQFLQRAYPGCEW